MWRAGLGKHNRMMAVIFVLLIVAFCALLRTNTGIGGFLYACMVVCYQILEGCLLTFFLANLFFSNDITPRYSMISLEVIGIGAVISYGIALLMKLTLIGIRALSGEGKVQ